MTVKNDWALLSIEERERRALKLLHMWDQIKERRAERERLRIEGPPPIVYDPPDGDELPALEAEERARARSDDDDPSRAGAKRNRGRKAWEVGRP